jgi:transmembrane sensor
VEQQPEHITEEQFAKYFAGEMSLNETSEIETWRNHSIENEDLFIQYEMLWQDLGVVHLSPENQIHVNTDEAWATLKSRKSLEQPQVLNQSRTWFKIAASIILVLGMFAVINQLNKKETILLAETTNNIYELQLADGSEITLNQNSRLSYPQTFRQETRNVSLSGEAFFKITENPDRPFVVKVGHATITVLGTSFNIKSSKNSDTVTVFVSSGKVRFAFENQEIILTANEKATLFSNQKLMHKIKDDQTGLEDFWRTKRLSFSGQKLSKVVETLNEAFDSKITIGNENISNCRLNVSFEDDSLDNILEVISLTLQLEITTDNNTITLVGQGCESN